MKWFGVVIRILSVGAFLSLLLPARLFAEETRESLISIEPFKPTYFLMGRPDTKIEISFKLKLIEGTELYLGYTQLMMWELFQSNPYFSDF